MIRFAFFLLLAGPLVGLNGNFKVLAAEIRKDGNQHHHHPALFGVGKQRSSQRDQQQYHRHWSFTGMEGLDNCQIEEVGRHRNVKKKKDNEKKEEINATPATTTELYTHERGFQLL